MANLQWPHRGLGRQPYGLSDAIVSLMQFKRRPRGWNAPLNLEYLGNWRTWLRRLTETDESPPLEYGPAAITFLDEILHGQP
jgi:hypothetical protein